MDLYVLKNVSFKYNDNMVLSDINLNISRGEYLVIVGPNGAGKSTLLKLLDFLIPPSRGEIYFDGKKVEDISNLKKISPYRRRVGLVFQDPDVELFSPTVYDDLAFGPLHMGIDDDEIEKRIKSVSRMLRIDHLINKPPFYLSDGEKKKAAIASVLTMDPEVLMVDEPTANLDPRSRREIMSILENMWKNGKTIIITTHELSIINSMVERMVVINSGRIIREGDPKKILEDRDFLQSNDPE